MTLSIQLGLLLLILILGQALGSAHAQVRDGLEVVDSSFLVQIDRSVRNAFGVYAGDDEIVVHIHNNGTVPPRLIDARTGQDWTGDLRRLQGLRRVYDYDSDTEPPGSYLRRLGCAQWRVCTSLEGADFVLMARQGPRSNLLEFRLLNFSDLFKAYERAFRGELAQGPTRLSEPAQIALEEVSRAGWRPRFRDALRSVRTIENSGRLQTSPWVQALRQTRVLQWVDASGYTLDREVDLAGCRAQINALKPELELGDARAARRLSEVVRPCADFFVHVVDWLMDGDLPARARMATLLGDTAQATRDEDMALIAAFLGHRPSVRPSAPPVRDPGSAPKAPPRTTTTTPQQAQPPASVMLERSALADAVSEYMEINKLPNKIQVLAFSENGGITKPDRSSLAGTVFAAELPSGKVLGDGQFSIEAFNKLQGPVKMSRGSYRVLIKARLNFVRADRCEKPIQCLFSKSEELFSESRVESIEFQLRPSDFRNTRLVRFGPLIPSDWGQTGAIKRELKELRLVLDLQSITPM